LGPQQVRSGSYTLQRGHFTYWHHFRKHRVINLLNVYGPCSERLLFWDQLVEKGLLAAKNLILAGDLNFTTGADEVWGTNDTTG
jgi:hypothetical protein